jgi:hypothetical protein
MTNLEEAIRERAYHLWNADGQPEGKADIYWLSAQREILTTSLEANIVADSAPVAARPAKKAKAARSDKKKVRAA